MLESGLTGDCSGSHDRPPLRASPEGAQRRDLLAAGRRPRSAPRAVALLGAAGAMRGGAAACPHLRADRIDFHLGLQPSGHDTGRCGHAGAGREREDAQEPMVSAARPSALARTMSGSRGRPEAPHAAGGRAGSRVVRRGFVSLSSPRPVAVCRVAADVKLAADLVWLCEERYILPPRWSSPGSAHLGGILCHQARARRCPPGPAARAGSGDQAELARPGPRPAAATPPARVRPVAPPVRAPPRRGIAFWPQISGEGCASGVKWRAGVRGGR